VAAKVDYDFRDPTSATTTAAADSSKKVVSALTGGADHAQNFQTKDSVCPFRFHDKSNQ
jgi:hypothetical protein